MLPAISGWEITEWTVAIAAFVTAAGVLWAKVIQPVRTFWRRYRAWMDKVEVTVDWVDHQMRRNGGMTLLDKVHATAEKVDELGAKVDQLLGHDAERDVIGKRYGAPRARKVAEP